MSLLPTGDPVGGGRAAGKLGTFASSSEIDRQTRRLAGWSESEATLRGRVGREGRASCALRVVIHHPEGVGKCSARSQKAPDFYSESLHGVPRLFF